MYGISKMTNLIPTSFLPLPAFPNVSTSFLLMLSVRNKTSHSSLIMWLPRRKFRPVTMHVQSYLKYKCGCFSWVLSHLKLKYVCMLECGKINYHLCFKISSSRNPSHEHVEVTLLTANKWRFSAEKGANRTNAFIVLICSQTKTVFDSAELASETRVLFQLGH